MIHDQDDSTQNVTVSKVFLDMTKTRNGLENGLVNGLSQILWKASCIIVLLF